MKRVLIVEDDELIRELEKDYLEASNYEVITAVDGKIGLDLALHSSYDLLLLDVMLPFISGFEICKQVRAVKDVAIIMVTAKREDIDLIRGLGFGADDYIMKPFSPSALVARVKAHLNMHERLLSRSAKPQKASIEIYDLKINPTSRRVFVKGKEITLTNKEYELLLFLAQNPNIVFSKDTLFDRIWGEDVIGELSTVTVHINRLREKIEESSSSPKYIETVWGAGYRFTIG